MNVITVRTVMVVTGVKTVRIVKIVMIWPELPVGRITSHRMVDQHFFLLKRDGDAICGDDKQRL